MGGGGGGGEKTESTFDDTLKCWWGYRYKRGESVRLHDGHMAESCTGKVALLLCLPSNHLTDPGSITVTTHAGRPCEGRASCRSELHGHNNGLPIDVCWLLSYVSACTHGKADNIKQIPANEKDVKHLSMHTSFLAPNAWLILGQWFSFVLLLFVFPLVLAVLTASSLVQQGLSGLQ